MAERESRRLPVLACFFVALLLTIVPMPSAAENFRPDWVALTIIYWSMLLPRDYSVGFAWVVGIIVDVAQGTLFGQHALALCFVAYVIVKFSLQIRVFPPLQMTATVFAILSLYQFILFWINGVAGIFPPAVSYWGPVLAGTLVWLPLSTVFENVRHSYRRSR